MPCIRYAIIGARIKIHLISLILIHNPKPQHPLGGASMLGAPNWCSEVRLTSEKYCPNDSYEPFEDISFLSHLRQSCANFVCMSLLKVGIVGTVIAAICCFTPALVILLGAVGLSSLIGILDYVLLPALGIFIAIMGYALWQRSKQPSS